MSPSPVAIPIATRGSALARWQADHVAGLLTEAGAAAGSEVDAPLVVVETTGDRRLDVPLWEIGGKGVFVKEVQAAVLEVAGVEVHDLDHRAIDVVGDLGVGGDQHPA